MIKQTVPTISETVKRICNDLMHTKQLSDIKFGAVVSVNPLSIMIDQKNVITAEYLVLTKAVQEYTVDITVSWTTEQNTHKHGNGNQGKDTAEVEHNHNIKGRKTITVHNDLTTGEKVVLLRMQGGQKYLVLDRIDNVQTSGECV